MNYRRDVDGLRAVAVGAVLLMHGFHAIFPNGFLGVDVFFVISGFVITASLLRDPSKGFGEFIARFYARRFLRLLPALLLIIAVTSVAICLLTPRPNSFLKTAMAASFGLANVQLYLAQQDYFSALSDLNPFTHTWSLGVEEQFYLLVPILLWLSIRFMGITQYFQLMAVLLGLSLLGWIVMDARNAEAAFYLMPFRFWELAAGCLVALFHTFRADGNAKKMDKNGILLSGRLGATSVVIIVLILLLPIALPLIPTTFAIVIFTSIILFADTSEHFSGRVLNSAPVNLVGRASYSIYLWHWPLLVLSFWSVGDGPFITITLLILSVLLGLASLKFVEQPMRYSIRTRNRNAILGGVALMVVGATIPGLLGKLNPNLYIGKAPDMIAQGVPSLLDPYHSQSGGT